jgi:Ca-activated chloride channel family protein
MSQRWIPILLGLYVCVGFRSSATAQNETVFSSETRLVVLHATVVDKNGHLITNLPQSAFHVYENSLEQRIKVFRREDIPVSMGLVIDNSGSMNNKRRKVESASLELVKASNPQDEIFVINFNYDPSLDVDFTSDIKEMEKGLARIDSRGATAMRDSLAMALNHMSKASRDKKVILVITDGNDNISKTSLDEVIRQAQRAEVLIYAIGILSEEEPKEAKAAKRALNAITEATGGQVFYPKELADVENTARKVAHDIRNQYTIAYSPSNQALDGTFRHIKAIVNAPNRPLVRTRSGYYATPPGAPKSPASAAQGQQ